MNLLSLAFVSLSVVGVAPTLRAQTENVWPIVPPGDDSLRLAADVPGTSLRWQWSLNGSDWATASGLLPAGGEAAAFQAAPAGTFTPPPSPVPANLPEMTLTIRPIQGDGSVRVTMSRTSPAGTYSRQIGNWRISEDGAAPGPVNGRSFDLDVPASPGPPAYPATRLKVTVYDEWAAWPADTPVSQPPAGFTLEAWDAYTVPLLQSRHAIIEALVKPRPSRYPRLMYQVSAFANDSAYISWRGSDGSRQHSLVTAWPLRDGAGAPLSGLVEWETQGDTEDERRRIEVWVHRQATPFPWQTAAPPPATTPPSTPQLTEEAQEAVAPLLSRREALRHRLLYPVPRTIYEPPPFSDRPATTRQLYRPVFVPSYDRDLIGGGPQGDQPDGVVDWFAGCTHPIITEVCAKNTGSVVDAAGRTPDWVEIYNPTHSPFNLAGWHLTDKANTLPQRLKWTFPGIPATVVPAGGYLIVYAANLGFADPARPLHTNFNLSAEGGNVFLTDPAGVLVDQCLPPPNTPGINFPGQESDWSFGLRIVPGINGGGTVGYGFYTQSTPGTHNTTQGYARQCLAPVVEIWQGDPSQAGSTLLSTNSGVFVPTGPPPAGGAYRVRLRRPATEDVAALVHYTLNAAEPTTWSSFTGTAITLPLDRSAVVRAFTALSGCLDSPSSTCTILFRTDVVAPQSRPPNYPVQSQAGFYSMDAALTAAHTAPSGEEAGILVAPLALPVIALTVPVPDYFDTLNGLVNRPNKWDFEHAHVPLAFEWWAPGSLTASVQATGSLALGSHKFILDFDHDSNDLGRLKGSFFTASQTTRDQFDALILRHPNDYGQFTHHLHDLWVTDTHRLMGLHNPLNGARLGPGGTWPVRGIRLVHVFLNGLYWGVTHLTERVDNDFWASRIAQPKAYKDFDAYSASGSDPLPNLSAALSAADAAILAQPIAETDAAWVTLNSELEVDQFIDYLLLCWYIGEIPEDENSARAVRWSPDKDPQALDRAWRFFTYDPENAALNDPEANLPFQTGGTLHLWNPIYTLLPKLLNIGLFRQHLLERAEAHCSTGGVLHPAAALARLAPLATQMRAHLWAECARHTNLTTQAILDDWAAEQSTMQTFFQERASILLGNIQTALEE